LVHAIPDPRSFGSEGTQTVSSPAQASQAAARAAYIARVVAEAPPLTDELIDRLAGIIRPRVERTNATPFINEKQYQSWEIRRHLDSETPGKFGVFTAEGEAA
jgi:hypothetical protein